MLKTICTAILLAIFPVQAGAQDMDHWSLDDLTILDRWINAAPGEGLPLLSTGKLDAARASGDQATIDRQANALALQLARMHLLGHAGQSQRRGWHIVDTDRDLAIEPMLQFAVRHDTLGTFFALLRPRHSEYWALLSAFRAESDPDRRRTIARNLERWRWMPRDLGKDYVLVNAARFQADMWRNGQHIGAWRVIVGKRSTPTPVFKATIEGVVLNPWWEIPASIVRESVGALVRNNPAAARARGFVVQNGRYRQRPGPDNALGQMKLVMPNPYSVYIHDTPNRELFEEDVRAFSHGCIRIGDAIGFAATLLEGVATREEIDAILESRETRTLALGRPIPVYVAYFTAVGDGQGGALLLDDIYDRDRAIQALALDRRAHPFHAAEGIGPQPEPASPHPPAPDASGLPDAC